MSTLAPSIGVQVRSVLIATDFSPASERALCHATTVARLYAAKFYLLHVVFSVGPTAVGPEATNAATEAAWIEVQQRQSHLIESGALADLPNEFLVRQGTVWEEVEKVINEKQVDLLIIGTHGRRGLGKLLFGSVAEQIFRHADCPVLTVGPGSFQGPIVNGTKVFWPFLFATDFGAASLRALPYAVSFANRVGTKLILLHVISQVPVSSHRATAHNAMQTEELARQNGLRRLSELTENLELRVTPEFMAVFGSPSEKILEVAESFTADAIILGLHRSAHIRTASQTPGRQPMRFLLRAGSPVMTVRS